VIWCLSAEPILRLLGYTDDILAKANLFTYVSAAWVWPNAIYMCLRWYFQAQVASGRPSLSDRSPHAHP
jgi:Na+-driven multidrug efflux pump